MFKRIFGTASSLHSLQGATKTEGHSARTASRRAGLVAVLMAGSSIAPAMAQQAQQDNPLDLNPGMNRDSIANAVSADGTTAVGSWDGNRVGFIATSSRFDLIKDLNTALGVNANGTVVVGRSLDGNFNRRPMMWTVNGAVDLDPNGLYSQGEANAVNSDGTVIVGQVQDNGTTKYFRWTANGMQVGAFPFAGASYATGVSYDGSVVVGNGDDGSSGGTNSRAFRWIPATGDMTNLGTLNGGNEVHATGVSGDGRVVVGYAADGNQNGSDRAFYWTVDNSGNGTGIMTGLGTLNGGSVSRANATNRDGSVIVGIADIDGQNQITRGFRWTQATDMITVDQWLTDNGVTVGNNVTKTATGVSADGSVVVGQLQNGHAYIARGPVPVQPPAPNQGGATNPVQTTTAGLMDVTNYQQSLTATPRLAPQVQNADVVMNGAHSSPLFMLLDAGQSSAWFTGDGGYTSMRSAQGGIGAGEFGFGRGIEGGWTVRFAGGGQYARFDTPNAGNSVFSSGYIAPDVSYAVGGGVVATLSGYLNWGKADVRRGYLNGAANDSSFGSAATQTYGVRARLDWQDALKLASTGISPFVSYTYVNSHMNGYTETGGSFPVSFNGSREVSNAVRIGADATTPLNDQFALVTRFEYGHRFEKAGAGVSGQILGLTAFSMDGASVQQDWLRGGLGVSYKLGNGDGLVVLNTSNQTGKNTTWLSASYRVKF